MAKQQASQFTTIKIRDDLRRWIKQRAAEEGIPMYALVERMISKSLPKKERGKQPWEESKASA